MAPDRWPPVNPYAPPTSDVNAGGGAVERGSDLAERSTRLWAVTIDGLLLLIPTVPILAVGGYAALHADALMAGTFEAGARSAAGLPRGSESMVLLLVLAAGLSGLGVLAVAIYQWLLIARTGQSLGKKWNGIRIERIDSGPMTFGTGVFLRDWLPKIIESVPYLGGVFWLVDCIFIFRDDRRCVHDHIAGTRVVRCDPVRERLPK